MKMGAESDDAEMGGVSAGGLYLNIGLQNGVLLRTGLDPVTGDLSDTRTRWVWPRDEGYNIYRREVTKKPEEVGQIYVYMYMQCFPYA